ncbi:hypothetical protein [Mycobacterium haemophilum]|uniref:hypothetical protein n=1 Tax=Mycobacterium haemophilum TaxID=29311 RepID=UPI001E3FC781|nr:hypothetical protein [Mycobacterium haemophilum]
MAQRHLARNGIVNAGALIDFEKGRRWPRRATLANSVRAPLMAEAVEVALTTINNAIELLPAASEADFGRRAANILTDLRKLETVAAGAARSAKGAPEVALVLSAVRRCYTDLMLPERAPGATLGQRLYAARHRAELTAAETANAAGVSPSTWLSPPKQRCHLTATRWPRCRQR